MLIYGCDIYLLFMYLIGCDVIILSLFLVFIMMIITLLHIQISKKDLFHVVWHFRFLYQKNTKNK